MIVAGKDEEGTACAQVVAVLDMPFSLVADVMFLPNDFHNVSQRSKNRFFPEREEHGEQSTTEQAALRSMAK